MSQIGDFMALFSPCGSLALLGSCSAYPNSEMTLAHHGQPSQALDADPASDVLMREADDRVRAGVRDYFPPVINGYKLSRG
jgi:hypothetical protein